MDIQKVRQLLSYSPLTGKFTWNYALPSHFSDGKRTKKQKARMFNARFAGKEAFTARNKHGYLTGRFFGKTVAAHRMAWFWMYGKFPYGDIDHINGDRSDNRIENLRDVPKRENARNMGKSSRNKSGIVGVRFNPKRERWEADIRVDYALKFLGRFKCLGRAIKARNTALADFGFHSNHGRR